MRQRNFWPTDREYAIMNVLWENHKDMTINEICDNYFYVTTKILFILSPK